MNRRRMLRRPGSIRLELLLFAGVLVLLALAAYLAWGLPPLEGLGGYPHDRLATLRSGGSGVERHAQVLGVGWVFGVAVLTLGALLVGFGARQRERLRGMAVPLIAALLLNVVVFSWMMLAYADSLSEPTERLFLGFPLPSAILLYLFYPASALFNVLFVVGFRRWVLTSEDEARYRRIVERLERRRRQDDAG